MRTFLRRTRFVVFSILLLATLAPAQAPRQGLLWEATSPTATVYLLGSVHVAEKEIYPLAKPVEDAFAASKVLVVEVDVTKEKDTMAALIQSNAVYTDGSTLSQHISKSTSDALDTFCSGNGVPRDILEPMKPWMVELMVALLPLQKAGIDESQGIDLHFLHAAGQKRVDELESGEFQVNLLASGTESEQEQSLADTLKHSGESLSIMRRIQAAFLQGDADAVQTLMDEMNTGPESKRKRMLDDRNPPMAEKIENYLKGNEQVFVVVGAAHLVGPQGIIEILRNRKYKVEQVRAAN